MPPNLPFNLREGMKWSDGAPFTSADFRFWFDEEMHNEDLTPVFPAWLTSNVDGVNVPAELSTPDDTTVSFKFARRSSTTAAASFSHPPCAPPST